MGERSIYGIIIVWINVEVYYSHGIKSQIEIGSNSDTTVMGKNCLIVQD